MYCWIDRPDGHALLDDTGAVVGVIIDFDKQIHQRKQKRLYGPSSWFKWHMHKKQESKASA
jgi:hypothetical protein